MHQRINSALRLACKAAAFLCLALGGIPAHAMPPVIAAASAVAQAAAAYVVANAGTFALAAISSPTACFAAMKYAAKQERLSQIRESEVKSDEHP